LLSVNQEKYKKHTKDKKFIQKPEVLEN